MRLAKLTLSGFKSFADKTEFSFDAPVTGVVGLTVVESLMSSTRFVGC